MNRRCSEPPWCSRHPLVQHFWCLTLNSIPQQTKGTVLSVCKIVSNWYYVWYMLQLAQILAKKMEKGGLCVWWHRTNRTYPTYRTPTCWPVISLTCWPVDSLTSSWEVDKKRSGTREGARPGWSYSIDMCQIKLIRALDQQLRGLCLRRCFRT